MLVLKIEVLLAVFKTPGLWRMMGYIYKIDTCKDGESWWKTMQMGIQNKALVKNMPNWHPSTASCGPQSFPWLRNYRPAMIQWNKGSGNASFKQCWNFNSGHFSLWSKEQLISGIRVSTSKFSFSAKEKVITLIFVGCRTTEHTGNVLSANLSSQFMTLLQKFEHWPN